MLKNLSFGCIVLCVIFMPVGIMILLSYAGSDQSDSKAVVAGTILTAIGALFLIIAIYAYSKGKQVGEIK